MNKEKEIRKLKNVARKHYMAYDELTWKYSCGAWLSEYLSRDITFHKDEFNKAMNRLAELDPTTPADRL